MKQMQIGNDEMRGKHICNKGVPIHLSYEVSYIVFKAIRRPKAPDPLFTF
jgi:hypothetical protein